MSLINFDAPRPWIEGGMSALEIYRVVNKEEPSEMIGADLKDIEKSEFVNLEKDILKDFKSLRSKYSIKRVAQGEEERNVMIYGIGFVMSMSKHAYMDHIDMDLAIDNSMLENPVIKKYYDFIVEKMYSKVKNHKSSIYIIQKNDMGLDLRKYPIKAKTSTDYGFSDLYNDDFMDISDRIFKSLESPAEEKQANGITLLHGDVGTGKTNYLRYLISNVNKRVIYLPPDLSGEISSPTFLSFLMQYPDSVLVIEDAENVLKTRDAGGNQAVSNILNMSDGILGDALALHVVCTFNDDIKNIDTALLREGRLVEIYQFGKLSEDKTLNLFQKVHGEDAEPPESEMTLSQIFNCEDFMRKGKVIEENKFGFM